MWGSCCWNLSYGDANGHCYRRRDKSFSHCNGPDCGKSGHVNDPKSFQHPTTSHYFTTAHPTAATTPPYATTMPPVGPAEPAEPEECEPARWSGCICKEGFVWNEFHNPFTHEYEYVCVPDDRCLDDKVCRSDEYFVPRKGSICISSKSEEMQGRKTFTVKFITQNIIQIIVLKKPT